MASSMFFLNFVLLLSSFAILGCSRNLEELNANDLTQLQSIGGFINSAVPVISGGPGGGGVGPQMPCVQKLLPCKPYLHFPTQPPATCCVPLNDMVANETQCLCAVISNPGLLQTLNITEADALKLAKSCGAKADSSVCKNAISPASSPTTPVSPPGGASPPTGKSAAYRISHYSGKSEFIIAFFVALAVLAF